MIVPYPEGIDWEHWAETVAGFNPELSQQLHPSQGWRRFAAQFALANPNVPHPTPYRTWQQWAHAVKQAGL